MWSLEFALVWAFLGCIVVFEGSALVLPSRSLPFRPRHHAPSLSKRPIFQKDSNGETLEVEATTKAPQSDNDELIEQPICRIVTRADAKLPTRGGSLPPELSQNPFLLDKLDAYYNAEAHKKTKSLEYWHQEKGLQPSRRQVRINSEGHDDDDDSLLEPEEEKKLVGVLRESLEHAGFESLSRRDIDLCDSLNTGYLLRLSIIPDVANLDQGLAREFHPELFYSNGTAINKEELLFDGRVLVYWRGYSEEVTRGRLILPKIDYLQASIVQGAAAYVKRQLDKVESRLGTKILQQTQKVRRKARKSAGKIADSLPTKTIANVVRSTFGEESDMEVVVLPKEEGRIKLGRYGGSKVRFVGSPDSSDAMDPFIICEVQDGSLEDPKNDTSIAAVQSTETDMMEEINRRGYTCLYDENMAKKEGYEGANQRMTLLQRVSISNLVNLFTQSGRRKLVEALFAKSELVEPTYEEVVVIWRPKPKEKIELAPPKVLSELADMLDIEGFEQPAKKEKGGKRERLEIRNFESVPMANLPAVLPKTKLIFRPADAFLFDMISFVTFLLVIGSIRLDSPRLDLLALVSVSLWIIRTAFRYSNKLARYDLIVKKFLTSKISHRNGGALKYLMSEAGSQRAVRSALLHLWISQLVGAIEAPFQRHRYQEITKSSLQKIGQEELNNLLNTERQVQMDINSTLDDLESLNILDFGGEQNNYLTQVLDPFSSADVIKTKWAELIENEGEDNDSNPKNSTGTSREDMSITDDSATKDGRDSQDESLSLKKFEERRKRFIASFAASQRNAYVKTRQVRERIKHQVNNTQTGDRQSYYF